VELTPFSDTAMNNEYEIKVTIHDRTRQAWARVLVRVVQADDPVLSVISSAPTNRINPSDRLVLYGSASVSSPASARWGVDDSSLGLASITASEITRSLNTGSNSFHLVIPPYSLRASSKPYVFSLSVGGFSSQTSLSLLVNAPPSRGSFFVNPHAGIELTTIFIFSALYTGLMRICPSHTSSLSRGVQS
jgi:hypothetical protein